MSGYLLIYFAILQRFCMKNILNKNKKVFPKDN